jgi:hypothetical protein
MKNHLERLRHDICGRDEIFCDQSFDPSFKQDMETTRFIIAGF